MSATVPNPAMALPRPERQTRPPAPFVLQVCHSAEELAPLAAAWDDLVRDALEPNPFLEPWFLLPALRAFAAGQDVSVVVVTTADPQGPPGPRRLAALMPLQRRRRCKRLPIACYSFWHHAYSTLGGPLLRAGQAHETLAYLLDWLATSADGASLLELPLAPADGPFHQVLIDYCRRYARPTFLDDSHTRALFRPRQSAAAYLDTALSPQKRNQLARLRRRLAETGRLEVRALDGPQDARRWADDFLALESAGWKGRRGTAMAAHDADRSFFHDVVADGAARGRVDMLGLFLDGRPIALKCNLLAPPGAFAFKIAYDENFARFSPGAQLELANIERLHERRDIHWMDSCAVPDHSMINLLWPDRRPVQTLLLATGRWGGDLIVSLLPLARWLKRAVRHRALWPRAGPRP